MRVAPLLIERLATASICGYEVNIRQDQGHPAPRPVFRNNDDFRPRERRQRDRAAREERPLREARSHRDSRKREPRFYDRFNRRSRRG